MASESSITTSSYIKHHLQNLTFGEKQVETVAGTWEPTGQMGFATSSQEAAEM
ncbi:MAG: F0F1 ATP synthase subunit A, partial [Piscirickettsiaceae bacterium]|nr:F0F1 ATP synthase subunit A [Piscirickettsiaceae bacterium]